MRRVFIGACIAIVAVASLLLFIPAAPGRAAAADQARPPACGREMQIRRIAAIDAYYPRHPQCLLVPFEAIADVEVSSSGRVARVHAITISGAPDDKHACIKALVTDMLRDSARFDAPPRACMFGVKVDQRLESTVPGH